MQLQRILLLFIVISASCSWSCSQARTRRRSAPSPESSDDERNIERLWAAALRAINEAELQRLAARPASYEPVPRPQRVNSKRLKWRTNSKLLDGRSASKQIRADTDELYPSLEAEARSDYVSTASNSQNPTYIDVSDYTPAPAPWWFWVDQVDFYVRLRLRSF